MKVDVAGDDDQSVRNYGKRDPHNTPALVVHQEALIKAVVAV